MEYQTWYYYLAQLNEVSKVHVRISLVLASSFLLSSLPISSLAQESPWSVEESRSISPSSQTMPEPVLTPSQNDTNYQSNQTNGNYQTNVGDQANQTRQNYKSDPKIEINQTTETSTANNQSTTTNQDLETLLKDPTISSGWRKPYLLGQQRFDKGLYSQAATAFKTAQKAALKDTEHPALATCTNKCLIRSYMSLKDYPKALLVFNECFQSQLPGALDEETAMLKSQIDKSYRIIDLTQFSPKAQEVLNEAQIKQIEVFPYFDADKTLVKVTGVKRFVKDTGSSDVPKVGLAKLVSFEFSEMPGQGFKIGNITGFQILAKMWVNLVESIFNTANVATPTAQVTAEKMGFQKTVSVNIPENVLKPLNMVLDRITTELRSISPNTQNQPR